MTDVAELKDLMLMAKGTLFFLKALSVIGSTLAAIWAGFYINGHP